MTRILIAQPTTGDVVAGTVGYLMRLVQALQDRGIGWDYRHLHLSDIALSRNIFASYLISRTEHTHLLFIDSDMGFMPETILSLVELGEPVTACACPKRYLGWDRLRRVVEDHEHLPKQDRPPTGDMVDVALEYNVDTTDFGGGPWKAERRGNFLKAPAVGTGIMLIHRDVFEVMLAKEVAKARAGYKKLPLLEGAPLCDFFNPIETPDGTLVESEDISFCKRWVADCGGEIWVDIASRILHYGMRGHAGRYWHRAMADFPEIAE